VKEALIIIGVLILVVILLLVLLSKNQERLIFYPEKLPLSFKFDFSGGFEEINFTPRKKIKLNALWFKTDEPKGLVLYFHGNAGSLRTWANVASDFTNHGWDVLIYDYRGYGKSNGLITNESMLHRDAQYVYDQMRAYYEPEHIIFYGRSLGSGIAAKLATKHEPALLMLETPYFSFDDVVRHHYSYLPTSMILRYRFPTNKFLKRIKCPVQLYHGTFDQLIPYDSSLRLEQIAENIELLTLQDGTHNNLNTFAEYHTNLKKWLAS